MNSLRYYNLDKLIEHCSYGKIDMHEPIEVANQSGSIRSEMSILKHFVVLSKSQNISLIHILSRLRCNLKNVLLNMISNNAFIRHYIDNVIKEWRLDITPSDLLNDGLASCEYIEGDLFNYDNFTTELKCSQEGGKKID